MLQGMETVSFPRYFRVAFYTWIVGAMFNLACAFGWAMNASPNWIMAASHLVWVYACGLMASNVKLDAKQQELLRDLERVQGEILEVRGARKLCDDSAG